MSEFVTLKKSDSNYLSYWRGSFSATHTALVNRIAKLESEDEVTTFEVVSTQSLSKPALPLLLLRLLKLQTIYVILIPWLYVFLKNFVDARIKDVQSFIFATLGSVFVYFAFSIKNDINDYLSGHDFINQEENKPLLKGWVKVHDIQFVSWICLLVATLFATPVVRSQPEEGRVILVLVVLMLLGRLLSRNSYKNKRWGEIIFFIIIGPGVASGYQVALGGGIDTEVLAFGLMWAWAIQFLVHLNNFKNLLTSAQAQIKNTMTSYGFDRAKKILIIWWSLFVVLWSAYHYFYSSVFWMWFSIVNLVFWSIPTLIKTSEVQSPVGSELVKIQKVGYKNFLLMVLLLVSEFVWYSVTKMNWI